MGLCITLLRRVASKELFDKLPFNSSCCYKPSHHSSDNPNCTNINTCKIEVLYRCCWSKPSIIEAFGDTLSHIAPLFALV